MLLSQNDRLINEKKYWYYNQDVDHRIGQNSHACQHHDIANVEWVPAVTEYSSGDEFFGIHFLISPTPDDIRQPYGSTANHLTCNGNKPPGARPVAFSDRVTEA